MPLLLNTGLSQNTCRSHNTQSRPSLWRLMLCLCTLLAGCDGCRRTESEAERTERERLQRLPAFTSDAAQAFPADRFRPEDTGTNALADGSIKPGHWSSYSMEVRSNRSDQRGVIETRVQNRDTQVDPENGERVANNRANIERESLVRRPAVLPKGQKRNLEARFLASSESATDNARLNLLSTFRSNETASLEPLQPASFERLRPESYFLVILTNNPEKFVRWQIADWVTPDREVGRFDNQVNYRIVLPPTEGLLPIAETMLDWSATAVVVWDDLTPRALTPAQRNSLIDWLHFGGTLIFNGTAAADALRDTDLQDWMPIVSDGNAELDANVTEGFLQSFTVANDDSLDATRKRIQQSNSRIMLAGDKTADAEWIDQGETFARRRIGRGTVIQGRFDCVAPWLSPWRSYDSFVNAALLGRPPRVHQQTQITDLEAEIEYLEDGAPRPPTKRKLIWNRRFVGGRVGEIPVAVNTKFRIFARDRILPISDPSDSNNIASVSDSLPSNRASKDASPDMDAWKDSLTAVHPVSGIGGWKSDSPIVSLFRGILQDETGITIPQTGLVIRSLGLYLLVLIPLNYLVFRLIGRLEWAWLAVVPIALLGAFFVARSAQLDVGFVRTRNELAFLEFYPKYSRAHLTRVVGIYNSLATNYRIQFDAPDAAAQVIRSRRDDDRHTSVFGSGQPEWELSFDTGPRLTNLTVGSNSYRALLAEQMVDLGGDLNWDNSNPDAPKLTNRTDFAFADVLVVSKTTNQTRYAFVGGLSSGASKTMQWSTDWNDASVADLPMQFTSLLKRLADPASMVDGEIRLIGRIDSLLDGLNLEPNCPQVRGQTAILVHLQSRPNPTIANDQNLKPPKKPVAKKTNQSEKKSE